MSLRDSIQKSEKLFSKVDLVSQTNKNAVFPKNIGEQLRRLSYVQKWSKIKSSFWFHIELEDSSLLTFYEDSFSYYMSPYKSMEVEDYWDKVHGEEWRINSDLYDIVRSEFTFEEFEKLIETETVQIEATPIRYDYHPQQYKAEKHPVCHLHFGNSNEIRIGTKKILTPFAFSCFILRQQYPKHWENLVQQDPAYYDEVLDQIKTGLDPITKLHPTMWCSNYEEPLFFLA